MTNARSNSREVASKTIRAMRRGVKSEDRYVVRFLEAEQRKQADICANVEDDVARSKLDAMLQIGSILEYLDRQPDTGPLYRAQGRKDQPDLTPIGPEPKCCQGEPAERQPPAERDVDSIVRHLFVALAAQCAGQSQLPKLVNCHACALQ